jgi:hypothetical protein
MIETIQGKTDSRYSRICKEKEYRGIEFGEYQKQYTWARIHSIDRALYGKVVVGSEAGKRVMFHEISHDIFREMRVGGKIRNGEQMFCMVDIYDEHSLPENRLIFGEVAQANIWNIREHGFSHDPFRQKVRNKMQGSYALFVADSLQTALVDCAVALERLAAAYA